MKQVDKIFRVIFGWRLIVCFVIIMPLHIQAQHKIKFERITIEQNLSQNSIDCILQDKRGFLWFGTEDGLNRYDGYNFKIFRHKQNDKKSLSNSRIQVLFEDRDGTLWIGTQAGLNKYNRENEQFEHFNHKPQTGGCLKDDNIKCIIEDHYGYLWIGTANDGLYKYNRATRRFYSYSYLIPASRISCILEDRYHMLWIGTPEGIYSLDRLKNTTKTYKFSPESKEIEKHNYIMSILEDNLGNLWIGTKSGQLEILDRQNEKLITHQGSLSYLSGKFGQSVQCIFQDSRHTLWIGTYGGGLYARKMGAKRFSNFKSRLGVPSSLSNNCIYTIFEDKSGLIWIGTEGGLNKLDMAKNEFVHWEVELDDRENSLSDNYVWALFKDKSDILWIGTSSGLNKYDGKKGKFNFYQPEPDQTKTSNKNRIVSIIETKSDKLLTLAFNGELNLFDRKRERFVSPFYGLMKIKKWLHDKQITTILEDHLGNLWLGTFNGLLAKIEKSNKDFFEYNEYKLSSKKGMVDSLVTCLYEDRFGIIWIGNRDGIRRFNPESRTYTLYKNDPLKDRSLSYNSISCIKEDRSGTLWIGTYSGLNKFDRQKETFTHYWESNGGLPSNTIYGILVDNAGFLWISTGKGISRFNPKTGSAQNYDARDGLQSDEFNGGSYFKAADGEMFFGGTNGFTSFYPNRIKNNNHRPPTVITNFLVFNEPYSQTSPIETRNFELYYRDVFTIEYAALDFASPGKNRYKHKMEGVDPEWVEEDSSKRFATYTKLEPGKYTFQVKGANNDGIWDEEGTSVHITILPPFWQTWWFLGSVTLFIIISMISGYRMRTKWLLDKLAEQERIQKILKQSHLEMEKAKELAELRSAENEKLLSAIASIFIAVDSDGIIFQWNKQAELLFHISSREALKLPFRDVLKDCIPHDKLDEIMEKGSNQEESANTLDISVDIKTRIKTNDTPGKNPLIGKGIKLLIAKISPIIDSSGKKLGFLVVAEDITNRKEEEMQRNLSRKLESLGQMASGIAHEIKTPLQYIGHNARFVYDSFREVISFYELIIATLHEIENSHNTDSTNKVKFSERIEKHTQKSDMDFIIKEIPIASDQIINGVNRVSDIIKAMNEFSHPGRGIKEKSDVNAMLKSTLLVIQNRLKKNAEIQLELSEGLPLLNCYPGELNQAFLNILVNALDAIAETGKMGTIKISTSLENNEIHVIISDTGCGIPEENRDSIFNLFFTTKEVGKGTGQGLSLVHNIIIEKHKGRIDFTSKVNEGSTFNIYLPVEGELENGNNTICR